MEQIFTQSLNEFAVKDFRKKFKQKKVEIGTEKVEQVFICIKIKKYYLVN